MMCLPDEDTLWDEEQRILTFLKWLRADQSRGMNTLRICVFNKHLLKFFCVTDTVLQLLEGETAKSKARLLRWAEDLSHSGVSTRKPPRSCHDRCWGSASGQWLGLENGTLMSGTRAFRRKIQRASEFLPSRVTREWQSTHQKGTTLEPSSQTSRLQSWSNVYLLVISHAGSFLGAQTDKVNLYSPRVRMRGLGQLSKPIVFYMPTGYCDIHNSRVT